MNLSSLVIPVLLAGVALYGMGKRVDVYGALTHGAEEGLTVLLKVLPALVGLLTAVAMFRASGALEWLTGLCAPALEFLGIPPETTPLMLVRPVSGSGALAVGSDLIATYGPDSYIGRVALYGMGKRVDVYGALTHGAEEGLTVLLKVLPALVGLLTAVAMFRASGALEWLTGLCAPALEFLGIPPETTPLMLVRPVSGSGALAVGSDLIATYGPDSYIGRVAAVMLGSTETTFYTIAVYFGSAGIIRTRHTVPAALAADLTGFLASAFAVRLFFGA